ncbi:MAG TPA: hypothetical protein VNI35_07675 [Nitrospira sp.]|nr:hypothetical protein [Nitrospira sp.]
MSYSMTTLRSALQNLGFASMGEMEGDQRRNPFKWEDKPNLRVPTRISSQFHRGRRRYNLLNDLTEYCWTVYQKALHASGRQLIGRTGDLWVTQFLSKVNINVKQKQTLWDPWTTGNIQAMDKWAPVINDCWVIGGVHRCADFELVSKEAPGNLWDHTAGFHIVTGRELLGLRLFGYERVERSGMVIFSCSRNPVRAKTATLEAYRNMMKQMQTKGADSITGLIREMVPGLNQEIRSFNRSKLKPPKR